MRFGKTDAEKLARRKAKFFPESKGWKWTLLGPQSWASHRVERTKRVYAWFPVKLEETGRYVWLEYVERTGYHYIMGSTLETFFESRIAKPETTFNGIPPDTEI